MDPAQKLFLLIVCILGGLVAFVFIGIPLIRRAGKKMGELFDPSNKHFNIQPEYSLAEARARQGRYAEAVEEFRVVIAKFPADVQAHVRIAEIMVEHFHNPKAAEFELVAALAKTSSEDGLVMASGRLADLYQNHLADLPRAIAVMEQLCAKFPGTKAATRATERLAQLRDREQGYVVPVPPSKIAFRKRDER